MQMQHVTGKTMLTRNLSAFDQVTGLIVPP